MGQHITITTSLKRYHMDMENKHDNAQLPLRLRNGKFMRGNVEVAPEIGNREQIELLRKAERDAEEQAEKGVLDVSIDTYDFTFKMKCRFNCICGHSIVETDYSCVADALYEIEDAKWEGDTIRCPKCGREYEIEGEQAKLINNL